MTTAAIIQLIAQVGLPLAIKILEIWKEHPGEAPADIVDRLKKLNQETLQDVIDATP